ncbi:Gfo/Idh/MocA family oxidoreductase (plasmid) [Deinococcus metallilatus]|uniref:Gfo/Idh/MocA family oxidoreductase n=3 Tax=Deinococcus metallilatus TaxID=1211322 RepID=A0AAJ5K034_9DEIO|nr:Gfo/Idh/MocA family oxidoreductase [Deinococcus metallilatus]TLK32374.1 Gfo/Idh/MocA family oxidoreductase [Deinococcus metallilatus]
MERETNPMTLRIGLIGAGNRGIDVYGTHLLDQRERARIVAISDPRRERLLHGGQLHSVPAAQLYGDAAAFWAAAPNLRLDAVIIASPDDTHHAHTLHAVALNLPILLEKPIANNPAHIQDLQDRLRNYRPPVIIAHVLRYTPFFQVIKTLLDEKRIGQLIHINHTENIGYWHFAHSYVRGNWRRHDTASPMVLAKSSHDLDILRWFAGAPVRDLSAYGALHHFKASEAPAGSTAYCLDGCAVEAACPYSARKIYLERFGAERDWAAWPNNVVTLDSTPQGVRAALEDGPYGRCVYRCDNDVFDTYSINLQFENQVTATFTLTAFTEANTRTVHLVGTHGEIHGHMAKGEVVVADFRHRTQEVITLSDVTSDGHGGGDRALLLNFIDLLERYRRGELVTSLTAFHEALDSHSMAFRAHQAASRNARLGPVN